MKRACVIGNPVTHSRSPLIHGFWLKRYGIDGAYEKIAVSSEELPGFLQTLDQRGLVGCNVTVPHKEAALKAADVVHDSARATGAANTLWREAGRLHAMSTDAFGFMASLNQAAPEWPSQGTFVSVLGAGGAARSVIQGFLDHGVSEILVFNRSMERAAGLARHFGTRVSAHPWSGRSAKSVGAAVIVNATSLGLRGEGDVGLDFAKFDKATIAADLVYVPLETPFLAAAKKQGLKSVDGLGMLLHQAVPGFEKWFGVKPEVTNELRALVEADIGAPV